MSVPLRVADVRQWTYCPRVVYWREVVPVRVPETPKMRIGRVEEDRLAALEERRGLRRYGLASGQRRFDVRLDSPALGVSGIVDMVVDTTGGPVPVDYKMVRLFGDHQRLQIAGYAVLLAEESGRPVPRGFLYAIEREEIEVVEVTEALRTKFLDALAAIRDMIARERIPEPTDNPNKCAECEYLRFCNDVW